MTGATGLIGRSIRHALTDRGDEVIALTRSPRPPAAGTQWIVAPPTNVSDWGEHVDGCNAVINLAGEPIAQRWSASAMTRIVQSRVGVTTALFHAIEGAKRRPAVMLSASAVGFYGSSESETFTEESPQGHGFLARVCEQWEDAAERSAPLTRVVRTRFGIVFTRHGGALPKLLAPYRMMMGGPLGSGKQWMSWVSLEDTVQMLLHALDESKIEGAFNVTAPEP
ncbi:MAG: TIGR01777 family oxidoreductase, partial [Myxococcota bacterium]